MSQWDIGFKFNFEQDFHYKYGFFTAFLFQIFTLIFRYKNCKQRLHVHLGNRESRRLLLGTPQTPSYRKRTSLFIIMWRTSSVLQDNTVKIMEEEMSMEKVTGYTAAGAGLATTIGTIALFIVCLL